MCPSLICWCLAPEGCLTPIGCGVYREVEKMKKTENTRHKRNFKRGISLLLSFMMSFVFLMANGCEKAKTIEDYPDIQTPVEEITDVEVTPVVDEDEEVVVAKETINRGYDSIYDTGTFVFNPEAVNPAIKEEMKNKETSYKVGIDILNAIHEHKTEFELSGDDEVDELDFNRGFKLARTTSPMATCVDITMVDTNKYKINYFPAVSADGSIELDEDTDMSEVENRLNAFEEYVTEMINNNITADDDYMERAKKIYKALIEDIELVHDTEILGKANLSNPMYDIRDSYDTDIIDVPETKKLNHYQFLFLYDYFLSELNVEHYVVLGRTLEKEYAYDWLDEDMESTGGIWAWMIVADEDNNFYNCDILMDELLLDEQRKTKEDYESDMAFFGMSDKTRSESFNYVGGYLAVSMTNNTAGNGSSGVPKCENDYNK